MATAAQLIFKKAELNSITKKLKKRIIPL